MHKTFPLRARAEWERELSALQMAAGPGVPRLLAHGSDAAGEAWLELADVGDEDLRGRVGRVGPLPAAVAVDLASQAAAILARLHGLGIVHGDVKPANLVLAAGDRVHLVDFGHARLLGDATASTELSHGFTGGTHGFAPPEAYLGHQPDPAFDVYGLGASLHFALTGFLPQRDAAGDLDRRVLQRLRPTLPPSLGELVASCLAGDPARRPRVDRIRSVLASIPKAEPALELALLAGEAHLGPTHQATIALHAHWRRKLVRLLASVPPTPDGAPSIELALAALRFCRTIHVTLGFLPLMPEARERLARAQRRLPELLASLPGEVKRLRQEAEFEDARQLARFGIELCRIVSVLHLPARETPALVEATGFALQSVLKRLDQEEVQRRQILAKIEVAERSLDLAASRQAMAELSEGLSGANRTTARIRDRHNRFLWLLERLVAARAGLQEAVALASTGESPVGAPVLLAWVERARQSLGKEPEPHRSLSLCARVLGELGEGWPQTELGPAIAELAALRSRLSERTIALLDQMASRLTVDPVPVRLLLRDLLEVDRILLLDCLVDTPRLARTEVLDRLEQLRLRVEEVTDRHWRIAQGAREQMEQGRLTTALYDLERALKLAAADDDQDGDTAEVKLARELEEVRELREGVRAAARRNLELAALYDRLRDTGAPFDDRRRCLEQREQNLLYLLEKGVKASADRYRLDLREVRWQRDQELSEDAEQRFLSTADVERQMAIARDILQRLGREGGDAVAAGSESHARRKSLVFRWESYYDRARRDALARELEAAGQRRRRLVRWAIEAVVVVAALAFGIRELGRHSSAGSLAERVAALRSGDDCRRLLPGLPADSPYRGAITELAAAFESAGDPDRLAAVLVRLETILAALPATSDGTRAELERQVTALRGRR